jgi:hypothetical protein
LPEHNWLGLFKNKSQLPILILIILLLVNYLLNLKLGGMLFGDERFEIAQINLFIAKGPTLLDPVFGVHGVPPATYSLNILHIVEASFSKILHVPAVWTWFYSHAFCNFIIWLGLFSTFIEIFKNKIKPNLIIIISCFSILIYQMNGNFFQAELHSFIELAWMSFFIISLFIFLKTKESFFMIPSSILVASSHPLNSGMTIIFILLLSLCLIFGKEMSFHYLIKNFFIPIIILLTPVVIYFSFPHGIIASGFNDGSVIGSAVSIKKHGFIYYSDMPFFRISHDVLLFYFVLFCFSLFYSKNKIIKNNKFFIAIFLDLMFFLAIDFYSVFIGLVGAVFLFLKITNKRLRIFVALLFSFFAIIAYNPFIDTFGHGFLPSWSFSRFQSFNVMAFFFLPVGLYAIIFGIWRKRFDSTIVPSIIFLFFVFSVGLNGNLFQSLNSYNYSYRWYEKTNRKILKTVSEESKLSQLLADKTVFSNKIDLPLELSQSIPLSVFVISNNANTNPAEHIDLRKKCSEQLVFSFSPSDLAASGITAIIVSDYDSSKFSVLLKNSPYVFKKGSADGYTVYYVNQAKLLPFHKSLSICNIPN